MTDTARTYELPEAVTGAFHHAMLGEVAFEFPAGTVEARSEQDEFALDELVEAGRAELVDGSDQRRIVSGGNPSDAADTLEAPAKAAKARKAAKAAGDSADGSTDDQERTA